MGGIKEHNLSNGRTVEEAFARLQEDLLVERGQDPYAGHQGNNYLDTRKIFKSPQDLDEWLEKEEDKGNYYKGTSFAYEIAAPRPNTNKIKTSVLKYPNHGTRRWETVYVGVIDDPGHIGEVNIMEKTQADAIKKARDYVEKYPEAVIRIQIGKKTSRRTPNSRSSI